MRGRPGIYSPETEVDGRLKLRVLGEEGRERVAAVRVPTNKLPSEGIYTEEAAHADF